MPETAPDTASASGLLPPAGSLAALPATDLSARLAARDLSAEELMRATLDRIAAVNPKVNAIVSLRPEAELLAEAHAADAAPRRGWLHGIPMAVKDLAPVKGIRSTWGSPIFADHVPTEDGVTAANLRAAGAILIGKTNVPEYGLGSHSFNPVFGVTRNPYDLSRSAGGSSGGAAAALATGMLAVADGSDMMGSLRNPAAFCNVWGFRPSYGLVPADPQGEIFLHQLATNGPMARNVTDLAHLLEVMARPDPRHPHTRPTERFATDLEIDPKGMRIGWLGDWGGALPMEEGILTLCETRLKDFAARGCIVEAVAPPFPLERIWEGWTTLRSWTVAGGQGVHYEAEATRALLKPEMIWEIERGLGYSAMEVHRASLHRSDWFAAAVRLFETYDAVVLPSAQVWPFPAEWRWPQQVAGRGMDSYHRWMEVVVPASLLGLPALSIPAGFGAAGLPMGLQLIGPRGADRKLLRLGRAVER